MKTELFGSGIVFIPVPACNCIFLAIIPQTSAREQGAGLLYCTDGTEMLMLCSIIAKPETSLMKLYFDVTETGNEISITSES